MGGWGGDVATYKATPPWDRGVIVGGIWVTTTKYLYYVLSLMDGRGSSTTNPR